MTETSIASKEVPTSDYKDTCLAKLQTTESILNTTPIESLSPSDVEQTVRVVEYLSSHIEQITPHIHDLWSAHLFKEGFSYAEATNRAMKQHALLTPYEELNDKTLEDTLAIGDMHGIMKSLREYNPHLLDTSQSGFITDSVEEANALLRVIGAYANNTHFIHTVAGHVHETWRDAQKSRGVTEATDPRVGKPFIDLEPSAKAITIKNAQLDFLAVGLFVKETVPTS